MEPATRTGNHMNISRLAALAITMLASLNAIAEDTPKETERDADKINYSLGYNIGASFREQGVTIDPDRLLKGIVDGQAEHEPEVPKAEMQTLLMEEKKRIQQVKMEKMQAEADNGLKQGVVTLPSGLQYQIIKAGNGASPSAQDKVTVNYRGTLQDGTEFDSSYKRNKPATFAVNRVIRGWTEALQLMKEGAEWKLFIPPDLAYGARASRSIPANSALVFDVELISVEKPAEQEKAPVDKE